MSDSGSLEAFQSAAAVIFVPVSAHMPAGGVTGSLSGLDDQRIAQVLREIEELSRRTQSVMLDVVAEADTRGIAAREGFGSTACLLAGLLRLSAAEARTRCEHAAMAGARRALTGEVLRRWPQVRSAPGSCG
ncbi:MAG: hypothetical protein ACT4NY_28595 [Pseudonocardiales bacterium]